MLNQALPPACCHYRRQSTRPAQTVSLSTSLMMGEPTVCTPSCPLQAIGGPLRRPAEPPLPRSSQLHSCALPSPDVQWGAITPHFCSSRELQEPGHPPHTQTQHSLVRPRDNLPRPPTPQPPAYRHWNTALLEANQPSISRVLRKSSLWGNYGCLVFCSSHPRSPPDCQMRPAFKVLRAEKCCNKLGPRAGLQVPSVQGRRKLPVERTES